MTTAAVTVETVEPQVPAEKSRPSYLKLYEATDALDVVREWLVESEGELTPEIEELLAKAEGDFDAKIERIALLTQEKATGANVAIATAKAIEEEALRHRQRAAIEQRAAASLKEYMKREMLRAERPKVERPLARVRIQKNSQPAVVSTLDEGQLAALYTDDGSLVKRTVTYALDAKAVVEASKRNDPLPDGVKVEVGSHVRIY